MKRMFMLSGPIGLTIVRLAYLSGIVLLLACIALQWRTGLAVEAPAEPDYASLAFMSGVTLLLGFILLRCLAEVVLTIMEIRDKLGAIERNTLTR